MLFLLNIMVFNNSRNISLPHSVLVFRYNIILILLFSKLAALTKYYQKIAPIDQSIDIFPKG